MSFFSNLLDKAITPWLGYNFVLFSLRDVVLASAGVDEVVFPEANISYFRQQGLSTKVQHIPRGIEYSDLIIRTPTQRLNTVLSSKLDRIHNYFLGKKNITDYAAYGFSDSYPIVKNFLNKDDLATIYDSMALVALNEGSVPIAVWYFGDLLLSNYKVEPISTMDDKLVREEISFKVHSFKRQL